jgi:hypothetical protein
MFGKWPIPTEKASLRGVDAAGPSSRTVRPRPFESKLSASHSVASFWLTVSIEWRPSRRGFTQLGFNHLGADHRK